ncbi:MAG: AbrB/MazE/SpoVT family DNA-binding domain-containing protein [Chloroflexi bacterium]|nr:MAG: AbrB/MazE/SpoVT family DNA-binding domain-containing protein [Chloroflexota bacterium]
MKSAPAKVTSKGQITIPQEVRRRLRLRVGDRVVFRLPESGQPTSMAAARGGSRVVVTTVPDLIALAGSLGGRRRGKARTWHEIRDAAWTEEARRRA